MGIIIYTIKNCSYCNSLKELLLENNIIYTEIDGDLPENDIKFIELSKITNSLNVPTIIVGDNILVPEISFDTIIEAIELIKKMS
jgi:glutaredoxin